MLCLTLSDDHGVIGHVVIEEPTAEQLLKLAAVSPNVDDLLADHRSALEPAA